MHVRNLAIFDGECTLVYVKESLVRIVEDGEESGASHPSSRWLKAIIPVLTVAFLLIAGVVLSFSDGPVRASSGTVAVDLYFNDDVGTDEMEQMLDRFSGEAVVLGGRIARPSLFRQAILVPAECDQIVSVRLVVASVTDANAMVQLAVDWYPYLESEPTGIGMQHGDMGSPLAKTCIRATPIPMRQQ